MKIRVSVYEDNTQLRDLLALLINGTSNLLLVGCYADCHTIEQQVRADQPDVIVMDIDMPDEGAPGKDSSRAGVQGIIRAKETLPSVRVLIHTVFEDDDVLFGCLKAGADGYILKRDTSVQLIPAIGDVSEGGAPMSPGIAYRVLQTFRTRPGKQENDYHITAREREILELLTQGKTYRQIAEYFSLSTETVRRHLKNIYHKLHVRSGTEAVAKALRERIIKP